MSGLVLCAVNQQAISGTCGSSGRQGWQIIVISEECTGEYASAVSPVTVDLWCYMRPKCLYTNILNQHPQE